MEISKKSFDSVREAFWLKTKDLFSSTKFFLDSRPKIGESFDKSGFSFSFFRSASVYNLDFSPKIKKKQRLNEILSTQRWENDPGCRGSQASAFFKEALGRRLGHASSRPVHLSGHVGFVRDHLVMIVVASAVCNLLSMQPK